MPAPKLKTRYLLLILFLFQGVDTYSQVSDYNFRRVTINDGLSLSSVYTIIQDSYGFMWFGTEDGLNKYDGQNFVIYNHEPGNINSLSDKWTEQIIEDQRGNIWLGSRGGVTVIDPATDEMRQFLHLPDSTESLSNDTVTVLKLFKDNIWVGTNEGLNRINANLQWNDRISMGKSRACNKINAIAIDAQDRAWIGSCGGLFVVEPGKKKGRLIMENQPSGSKLLINSLMVEADTLWVGSETGLYKCILPDTPEATFKYPGILLSDESRILNIYRDRNENIWVQTRSGLSILKEDNLVEIIHSDEVSPSLMISQVKPLMQDSRGNLWFGTFGNGLYKIDPENLTYQHIENNPANQNSLSDNTINAIYEDRSGTIWIGTFGAGISVLNPRTNLIENLKLNAFSNQSMSSSFVWSVMEASDGKVWIGTNRTGIDIYDPVKKSFVNIPPGNSLPSGGVRDIFESSDGTIWVGSDGGGLCRYNAAENRFSCYISDPEDSTTLSNNSVRKIYEDSTGVLWIGTRNGLNRFQPKTGKFQRYMHDPDDPGTISNGFVYSSIYMDQKRFLWVGTYGGGLNKMDPRTGKFESYQFDANNPFSISDNIVFSIYEDAKGYFWIGTNNGLNLFNPATGKFKHYGQKAGLPNDVIYGILPDQNNHLWMTTNKGISRLDLTEFKFKNYDVRDGLQSNEFNGGAYFKGESGKIYAGGVYGLSIIDPEKMTPERNSAELVISKLEILGKEVAIRPEGLSGGLEFLGDEVIKKDGNYYMKKHISYIDHMKLNYRERFFAIEFSALNVVMPEKLSYRYRMENLDESWTNAGTRNYVTYANMKPGVYYFEVDAVNGDGFHAKKNAKLKITITPPFWHAPWFIALEIFILIGLIILVYRILLNHRTNRIVKEQYKKIKAAHDKLQESEQNLKALNATKDKFFSIISHDLKNPFASVLSISELIDDNFDTTEIEEVKHGVKKIHQTNRHIYQLLENLLTWSKSQRDKLEVELTRFNLTRIIETNVNIVRLHAEKKNIEIRCNVEDSVYAYADREMVSTVIRNLLNNAVKFTLPGKQILIAVEASVDKIEVSIQDEGVGISEENLKRLFRIDDKFKSEGTAGEKGTGLGLIICKEFIEKNHGKLYVSSVEGSGSNFFFHLPPTEPDDKHVAEE